MSVVIDLNNLELIKEKLLRYEKRNENQRRNQKKYQERHPEKIAEIARRQYKKSERVKKYHEDPEYRAKILESVKLQYQKRKMKKLQEESNLVKEPVIPKKKRPVNNTAHIKRYHEDPEYREKILQRDRVRYQKIKDKKALEKADLLKESNLLKED